MLSCKLGVMPHPFEFIPGIESPSFGDCNCCGAKSHKDLRYFWSDEETVPLAWRSVKNSTWDWVTVYCSFRCSVLDSKEGPDIAILVKRSFPELEARADKLAQNLGMSRSDAFAAMDAGALPNTISGTELKLVRHLMDGWVEG